MGMSEINVRFFGYNRQQLTRNDFDRRLCQVNRSISMTYGRNFDAKSMPAEMMQRRPMAPPIAVILAELKWTMVVVVVVVVEVVVLLFVVRMSFVLNTHNGISVYHMMDKAIYLTAIGFFANVNKS